MELPPPLRQAVDRALSGRKPADLAAAAAALSRRYREERRDGRLHVESAEDALAYLAVRLPATYAAARASFAAIKQARADFAPRTVLDIGGGPGTALWAIGLLVGIDMLFGGACLIGMALAARNADRLRTHCGWGQTPDGA